MYLLDTDHIVILQQRAEPEFNRLSIRMSKQPADDSTFTANAFSPTNMERT